MDPFKRLVVASLAVVALAALACAEPGPPAQPAEPVAPSSTYSPVVPQAPRATPEPPPTPTAGPAAEPTPMASPSAPVAQFPLAVLDSNGKGVVFDSPPERIVAFDSAAVEILFAMGEGRRVIATHSFVSYPPEAMAAPRVGDAFNMDVEQVVALEPDLVFVFFDTFVPQLEAAGLKVLYRKSLSEDFLKVADHIRMWGQITGNPAAAENLAQQFEGRIARVREAIAHISGGSAIFQDVGGSWSPGPDTLVGEVFDMLRLGNIAFDVSGYAQLSPEAIVERNPAIILATDAKAYTENPAFKDVLAVKNGRVVEPTPDFFSVAGPRFADWIEELAALVYPGLFP